MKDSLRLLRARLHVPQDAVPIEIQVQQLGQKYMGTRSRQSHSDAVWKGMMPEPMGSHPVPISNFMNAQCKCLRS